MDGCINQQASGPSAFVVWLLSDPHAGPTNYPKTPNKDLSPLLKPQSRASYAIVKILDGIEGAVEGVVGLVAMFNMHKRKTEGEGHGSSNKLKKHKNNGHSESMASLLLKDHDVSGIYGQADQPALKSMSAVEQANALSQSLQQSLKEYGGEIAADVSNSGHELQAALQKFIQLAGDNLQTPPTPSQAQLESFDGKNIPKIISGHGLRLTGWKSSEIPSVLPDLPAILDPTLEEATFTHQGLGAGKITDLNYERLEFIGDSYVELTATLLITQTFPFHTPGKCSHIRENLVKNATFAKYAKQYGLDKRLKLPDSFTSGAMNEVRDDKQIKVLGDVFEAYVGAVVLSDPVHGLSRATQWLKDLWGMEILDLIIQEERSSTHNLKSPIWELGSYAKVVDQPDPSFAPLNHKDQLSKALGSKGIKISYRDAGPQKKDPATKLPIFTVGVYLDGYGEKDKLLAIGKANGKKEAGMKAAANVLADKKMMKFYTDKKKVVEAQQAMEAEALSKAGGA